MSADRSSGKELVERQILHYLLDHPAAADSAEGVRHWWLRGAAEISQSMVRDVLEELHKRGWLVTRGDVPERRIYALNEHARDAVAIFAGVRGERQDG